MPLSLLTPWLLGGIALVAVPWFIHRIRRPEREVVPFSSLMFVPVVERRVVERRNLQHILLMLMRMSLLLLLAMAFARPVVERLTAMSPGLAGVGDHLILIDISASMRSDGYLGESISRARELLDARTDADRVGLITFAQSTAVLAPLFGEDADAGQVAVARGRLALIEPTYESTDFHNAIRAALEHLRRGQAASDRRRVVHVLTDLQAAGLEEGVRGLVPLDVELRFIAVGGPRSNATVQDAIIARAGSSLIARARIKNWNIPSSDFTVRLVVDGRSIEERVVRIPPGNATRVDFSLGSSSGGAISGHVELADKDDLDIDNRRYFAWRPGHRWAIRIKDSGQLRPVIEAAVPDKMDLPFRVLAADDATTPDVVITDHLTDELLDAVEAGTPALLLPGPGTATTQLLAHLRGLGLRSSGIVHPDTPAQLAWADFDHPVFQPFKAPGYNDFTALRYFGFVWIEVDDSDSTTRVIARLDAGQPALLQTHHGEGRLVVWTAGIDPRWSSIIRDPRFVPLLHETLRDLTGNDDATFAHIVGESSSPPDGDGWSFEGLEDRRPRHLDTPGLVRWTRDDQQIPEAVNIDAREGELLPLDAAEATARLSGSPIQAPLLGAGVAGDSAATDDYEYGRPILLLALLLAIAEAVYASRLNRTVEAT